jgi:hypothetical protein
MGLRNHRQHPARNPNMSSNKQGKAEPAVLPAKTPRTQRNACDIFLKLPILPTFTNDCTNHVDFADSAGK